MEAPPGFKVRTAAWEVTDGEIASRIPVDAKMAYAGMYDAMRTFDEMTSTDQDQWASRRNCNSARPTPRPTFAPSN